jgi:hypothetical protein
MSQVNKSDKPPSAETEELSNVYCSIKRKNFLNMSTNGTMPRLLSASSVGIVTRLRPERPRNGVSIHATYFSVL